MGEAERSSLGISVPSEGAEYGNPLNKGVFTLNLDRIMLCDSKLKVLRWLVTHKGVKRLFEHHKVQYSVM